MKIGKFIFNRILSEKQREIIFEALFYSARTYKKRGDMDNFSKVSRVMGELKDNFDLKGKIFTQQEVDEIIENSSRVIADKIKDLTQKSYERGLSDGFKKLPMLVLKREEGIVPGMQFSKDKCESCEHKNDCSLYAQLKEEFNSSEESKEEDESVKEVVEVETEKKEEKPLEENKEQQE